MGLIADALSGGGTYLKWEAPGTSYTGVITDVAMRQARKFESTDLDFWDDGTAKMQVVLTLATQYRDASNPEDDGSRQLSINLWSGQKKALVAACKAAGVSEPEVGQTFTATHVSGIGNAKAPRVFEYVLGAAPTGIAEQLDVAPVAAPAAAAPAAPATNPAETAKSLLAAGMSAADVATATGLPANTVAALANLVAA
jgi:hypothetical protein